MMSIHTSALLEVFWSYHCIQEISSHYAISFHLNSSSVTPLHEKFCDCFWSTHLAVDLGKQVRREFSHYLYL